MPAVIDMHLCYERNVWEAEPCQHEECVAAWQFEDDCIRAWEAWVAAQMTPRTIFMPFVQVIN